MRHIATNFKTTQAARPWAICDSLFAAYNPVTTGSMVLSLFGRQYGMNT